MKFPHYPQYRSTGIEWIPSIPQQWQVKKMKFVVECNKNCLGENTESDYTFEYIDISSVDLTKGIMSKEIFSFENAPSRARRIVHRGDIIISTVRTYLRAIAAISEDVKNLIVSTGFAVLTPLEMLCDGYLAFFVQSQPFVDSVVANSTGVSYPAISATDLIGLPIVYPSLTEQRKITQFLSFHVSSIDNLIAEKERLLKLLEEKRIALITQAVTKGLDPNVKMKPSGIDWLGDIPEHWEVKRLKYLTLCNAEILNEDCDPDFTFDYVDISSVNLLHGIVNKETYTFERAPSRARRVVHSGDVIVSTVRTYLKAIAQVEDCDSDTIVSTGFAVLTPLKKLNNDFMYYSIQNQNFIDAIEAHSVGVSYPAINSSDLLDLSINLPPFEEQVIIVNYIKQNISKISELEKSITMAIEKFKEYRISLITAAVTGKIDVRDFTPEEEHEKVH